MHHGAVKRDLHSQVFILCIHQDLTHLHQVPVQLTGPEEELPLQLGLGPMVQQHQEAVLSTLPLQFGGTRSCIKDV